MQALPPGLILLATLMRAGALKRSTYVSFTGADTLSKAVDDARMAGAELVNSDAAVGERLVLLLHVVLPGERDVGINLQEVTARGGASVERLKGYIAGVLATMVLELLAARMPEEAPARVLN